MEEDEFKSKFLQLEGIISSFKEQLEENDGDQQSNNNKQVQLQNTNNKLTGTVESLNQTAQVVCDKLVQLQTIIDGQTKAEVANNRTVQELREKQK